VIININKVSTSGTSKVEVYKRLRDLAKYPVKSNGSTRNEVSYLVIMPKSVALAESKKLIVDINKMFKESLVSAVLKSSEGSTNIEVTVNTGDRY
jgi:hypothetical protein